MGTSTTQHVDPEKKQPSTSDGDGAAADAAVPLAATSAAANRAAANVLRKVPIPIPVSPRRSRRAPCTPIATSVAATADTALERR
jgi:hypothetical protein